MATDYKICEGRRTFQRMVDEGVVAEVTGTLIEDAQTNSFAASTLLRYAMGAVPYIDSYNSQDAGTAKKLSVVMRDFLRDEIPRHWEGKIETTATEMLHNLNKFGGLNLKPNAHDLSLVGRAIQALTDYNVSRTGSMTRVWTIEEIKDESD